MHLVELILETFVLVLMEHGTKIHGKNSMNKKNIDQKYSSSNYYDVKLNKCKVKTGTSLRF